MRNDYYTKLGDVVKFSSNIPASDIDEVIVWAELDGKRGWWKAELNNKGEVVLQATDNIKEVAAPAEKQTDFTTENTIGVLTKEDTQNMERIFGEDLFALWQDYYNKLSLPQIKADNEMNNLKINKITANNYGIYLYDMLKTPSDREDAYNGVKLSTVKKNKKEGYALINQPAFDEKQKENFYQVLQQIWEGTLKSLTEQRRQGINWNAYLRKRMDANIATIAYSFANIMPLEEESFSAVAALVYALYETAGIKAAPIKDKRALALYAISKDYDDYVENFRNFFDGNFVNIDANANIQTNAIPAKMLFTQEYKNTPLFLDDPANMYNNLPRGFEEEGVFYRGRIFDENGYEKFTQMFTQGLKGENATHGHGMVFATDLVKMAIYPYSLRTQHGHIPVIVKIKANKDNIPVHAGSNEFTFQNISPEEISEILVWVQNKWYKAQVSNNGEVVLQATDNIKEVAAPAQSPQNSLKNYILPAVIGGLGLTMMLSGNIASGLTLASLYIFSSSNPIINSRLNEKTEINAKKLFTDEYKGKRVQFSSWDDIKRVRKFLPFGFERANAFFRGMTLSNYEDLKRILIDGLPGAKTVNGGGKVFFSSDVAYAMIWATQYKYYGHLPILIKINRPNTTRTIDSYDNVSPNDITDILVWAELDGKLGWWRAKLDNNGEVVLQATDNIKEVAAPAQSPQNSLKNYILPVVGIGLLGLALSNPITAPLALASVPLLASTKPLITNKIDNNAISAQVLFTDEYKNKDIPMPTEDEESIIDWSSSNVDIARGMRLGNYDDLKNIFTEGLLGSKTSLGGGKVFFSSVINLAVMYAKPHDIKRYIPVIIISNKEVSNRDQGKDFWAFENFDAKDITDVFVWAELEGQTSWWRAELDDNGEVVLKYTGMKTLSGYGTFNNSY